MKITKAELKRIISEELTAMTGRQELGEYRGIREARYTREKLLKMIRDPEWEGVRPTDKKLEAMTDQQLETLMAAGAPEGP